MSLEMAQSLPKMLLPWDWIHALLKTLLPGPIVAQDVTSGNGSMRLLRMLLPGLDPCVAQDVASENGPIVAQVCSRVALARVRDLGNVWARDITVSLENITKEECLQPLRCAFRTEGLTLSTLPLSKFSSSS